MRNPIYFYHVPRTGGTATHKALERHPLVKLTGDHSRWHPRKGFTITLVRDPIAHAVSLYDYIRNTPRHGEHRHAKSCGSFAKWATTKGSTVGNFVKFFSPKVNLDDAINNLSKIGFIGLTHRLEQDVNAALVQFGIKARVRVPKVNGAVQRTMLSPKDIAIIKELRPLDFKLYRWVLRLRGLEDVSKYS